MKITDERKNNLMHFNELIGGEVIKYHDCYYIVLDTIVFDDYDDENSECNVIDMEDGAVDYIQPNSQVELITNYEFIIN